MYVHDSIPVVACRVPLVVKETVPDSGSPAILMIQSAQPALDALFSGESPAPWTPMRASIIKNAGEPRYRVSRTLGGGGPPPTRTDPEIPANRRTLETHG